MFQETEIEVQAQECGLRGAVTCIEATSNSLWVGTTAGLYLYRDLRAPTASFLLSETINALTATSATLYVAAKRNWGMYQIPATLRIAPIEPPEVTTAEYMEPRALAVWNNALAVASTTGLYHYSLSGREWDLADREVYQYLLASGSRLWACGRQLVSFDRQYRPRERVSVQITTPPAQEQSKLWWATASGAGIRLYSYSLGTGRTQHEEFRFTAAALERGGWDGATALTRWGAFWYVGLGGRRGGAVMRLNSAARRAEQVALCPSVSALAVWKRNLIIGTRSGLYTLAQAR